MRSGLLLAAAACGLLLGTAGRGARADDDPALALLSGGRWPTTVITYGFPGAGFVWEYGTSFTAGFVPADETEKALYRKALQEWAAASGGAVSFVETRPHKAQLRLAVTTASMGALPNGTPFRGWTYLPGPGRKAGDTWLQVSLRTLGYADGQRGGWVIRHEIGHQLGLKHPSQGSPRLPVGIDCAEHTVMTYRTDCADPVPDGWPDGLPSYPHVLGDLDGRAIGRLYAPPASVVAQSGATRQPAGPRYGVPRGEE